MKTLLMMAALVLALIPPVFIWHKVYQDGLFGRCSLAACSFLAAVFILGDLQNDGRYIVLVDMYPEVPLLLLSFSVFLVWHLFRFHTRQLREKKACAKAAAAEMVTQ